MLLRHPAVREVAVIGVPDAEWGEAAVAAIVAASAVRFTEAELDTLCLDHIARFKRPKRYVLVDELPKSPAGKVLKRDLREQLERRAGSDASGP